MYIEFHLPSGAGGAAAGYALNCIKLDIQAWADKFNVQNYKTKVHKYTFRLCLSSDKEYTGFALTWNPVYGASRDFKFVTPK